MEISSIMPAYLELPLNLPHAGRIALRMGRLIESRAFQTGGDLTYLRLGETVDELEKRLQSFRETETDPAEGSPEASGVQTEAARLGRILTCQIADLSLHDDRLGQCVRKQCNK